MIMRNVYARCTSRVSSQKQTTQQSDQETHDTLSQTKQTDMQMQIFYRLRGGGKQRGRRRSGRMSASRDSMMVWATVTVALLFAPTLAAAHKPVPNRSVQSEIVPILQQAADVCRNEGQMLGATSWWPPWHTDNSADSCKRQLDVLQHLLSLNGVEKKMQN